MNSIDFDKTNVTLGAGGNPNTRPIRIALCKNATMPNYRSGFLVSKWEMDEQESRILRNNLIQLLDRDEHKHPATIADEIMKIIPPVFLSCMHSMSPVMVLQYPEDMIFNDGFLIPDQEAADNANSKRVQDN
jgi:hypothetical protein